MPLLDRLTIITADSQRRQKRGRLRIAVLHAPRRGVVGAVTYLRLLYFVLDHRFRV